jgi:rhomboid protease GluP
MTLPPDESFPSGDATGPRSRAATPVRDFSPDMLADEPVDTRIDFERGMSYAAPATLAIIALCSAIFGWQIATGALESEEAIIDAGALVTDRLARGEAWRLLSSMFLHGSAEHLFGNMVALYILGLACEHAFGSATMLAIYAIAGIAGGLASAAFVPMPTVGASGAIFGLMGCAVAMLARRRRELHVRDARIGIVLGVWALWQLGLGLVSPMVANMAHIGGLLAGALLGWLIVPRLLDTCGQADQPRTSASTSSDT